MSGIKTTTGTEGPEGQMGFTFGMAVTWEDFTVIPLLGTSTSEPDYDTLDAALARGTLRITEVTESGHAPEIRVRNDGQRPVLIIDGEELVGAKQNRTVNLTILVAAKSDVVIPVTCVEAGRWRESSRRFAASPRTHFAAGRAAKSAQLSASLLHEGVARADQSEVWAQIADKFERLQARSDTGAMADIFEVRTDAIESFVRGLPVAKDQVGAVFCLNDEPMGVDLFDSPRTFSALISKIVRGYALDAIDLRANGVTRASSPPPRDRDVRTRAKELMRHVLEAPRTSFSAPGLGEAWRLFTPEISGGGLSAGGNLVHMSAFRRQSSREHNRQGGDASVG
jgi:hypothetical protein